MQPSKPCAPLTRDAPVLLPLHPAEARLLQHIRELGHGTLEVRVADGVPVYIEVKTRGIKLA
jgi:hypothetical protein